MAEHYPTSSKPGSSAKRWLWLLLVCVILLVVLAGLKYVQISKAIAFAESFPERSESVTAITLQPVQWRKMYRTIGEVKAAQYVDGVNFASRSKADAIMSVGFIDVTCPPSSCYAAYNQLKGKKQIINKPLMGHAAPADVHKAFFDAVLEHVEEQATK